VRNEGNRVQGQGQGATARGFGRLLGGLVVCLCVSCLAPSIASATGGVFVTGHDADIHSTAGANNPVGAQHIVQRSVAYVTPGDMEPLRLLLVTHRSDWGGGIDPSEGLIASGFTTFDMADDGSAGGGVLDLHSVNFANYDAVIVASDFGGWLRQSELDILNARAADLASYVNGGGGLVAFAESGLATTTAHDQFGFVPFVISSTQANSSETGNQLTAAGEAMGLTVEDINGNFSHNIFDSSGGMDTIDLNPGGGILSLATRQPLVPAGRIVVRKDAVPDDAQDFSFTAGGGLSPGSFQLDDDGNVDPTLSSTRTFGAAEGSGYSISETVPSGWVQVSASCDNGSPISSIAVTAGQTVTCTFTNQKRGKIVVVKDAVPDHSQDFSFTAGGGLSPRSFQLDDDSDPTLSNQREFSNLIPQSGYSIAESAPPSGWEQAGATCDDGSPVSNIDVSSGETVTCTFVNYQRGTARPRGASPLTFKLVPAFNSCTSPNTSHAAPLSSASCRPPIQASSYLTLNAPDRPAPYDTAANSTGMIMLKVACLTPGTTTETGQTPPCPAAGDQQDVRITSSSTDIRCVAVSGGCSAAGGQYDGKLLGLMTLRITDRLNGPAGTSAGTVSDSLFSWGVQCTGGACSSTTSADAVIPGLMQEGKRAIFEILHLEILDGGADGDLAAAPSPASGSCLPACTGNDGETVFLRTGFFGP
jgi:hypothetical protein